MIYPKKAFTTQKYSPEKLLDSVCEFLNELDRDTLLAHGRVYGGGLHKLEPRELKSLPMAGFEKLIGETFEI